MLSAKDNCLYTMILKMTKRNMRLPIKCVVYFLGLEVSTV